MLAPMKSKQQQQPFLMFCCCPAVACLGCVCYVLVRINAMRCIEWLILLERMIASRAIDRSLFID